MSDKTLLPCPFCGRPPETQGSGESQRGLMIDCATPGCVNPHVSYYDHETARRVWNTRNGRQPAATTPKEIYQLEWLARHQPAWGGHLERGEPISDPLMQSMVDRGLIATTGDPPSGYAVTEYGMKTLSEVKRGTHG